MHIHLHFCGIPRAYVHNGIMPLGKKQLSIPPATNWKVNGYFKNCFRFQVKSLPASEMLIGCVREWRKRNRQEIVSEERRR